MAFFSNKKSTLGVWISDHTIELALVADVKGGAALVSHIRKALKSGIVERGHVKRPRDLAEAFEELLEKAEPDPINVNEVNVVFGLQDCVAKTHVFTLPPHRRSETAQLVHDEVVRKISIPVDTLVYDFRVEHSEAGATAVVIATTEDVLDEWQSFFSSIDIVLQEITVESLALFRSIFANAPDSAACIVDLGQTETSVALYAHHKLQYRYALPVGGDTLTKAYAKNLKLTAAKAEKHKIQVGMGCAGDEEHKLATSEFETIIKEVKTALQLYKKLEGADATEVVLVGGAAFTKGLIEYFNDQLGVQVRIGQSVFAAQLKPHKLPGSLNRSAGIRGATEQEVYLQAIGFALMGVDPYWSDMHPSFELDDIGDSSQTKTVGAKILSWSFAAIFAAVIFGGGWVFWQEREMQRKDDNISAVAINQIQTINLKVPVEVQNGVLGDVRGRLIYTPRAIEASEEDAINSALPLAIGQLNENENLVNYPIESTDQNDKSEFVWLAYNATELESAYKTAITIMNSEQKPFVIKTITPVAVTKLSEDTYELDSKIDLEVVELLTLVPQITEEPDLIDDNKEEVVEEQGYKIPTGAPRVVVGATSIGYLNARSAPTTSASVVDELSEGEEYEFIEEDNYGWVHIRLDANRTAWVSGLYVTRK